MGLDEEAAIETIRAFYGALDELLQGGGTRAMNEIWYHGPDVTTSHPFGNWARGWAEVSASWEESVAVFALYQGHAGRNEPIGKIENLQVSVMGDVALATCVYKSVLYMSEGPLSLDVNCTNVARRIDGTWKIVHHHADRASATWDAGIGAMVQRGHS